jgi:thioredoxin reductase
MAVDTPARIAIFGAGPIGLEAGLYARFLGYEVDLYERGRVCEHLRRWGHVRLFSPAGMNRAPLGLAALHAQEESLELPPDDALLTADELVESYFLPLANSDLLIDGLHLQTEVLAVGREGLLRDELVGDQDREDYPFRILIRDAEGDEQIRAADIAIDATGTYGNPNWLGEGGIPALGELRAQSHIEYGLPDILGAARNVYAGKHVLLIGAGHSAATNILALAELAEQAPGTRVTWVTRHENEQRAQFPIACLAEDPLAERERVARAANAIAQAGGAIAHWPGATVHAARQLNEGDGFEVELRGARQDKLAVDRIVANVGHRPDNRIYRELPVQERRADEESLFTGEPHFYVLGSKSYGRDSRFLLSRGHDQIRQLFAVIGDREGLNLYQSIGYKKS